MSDPRNVAHAKKVTQEKKHHGTDVATNGHAAQPGKKSAAAAHTTPSVDAAAALDDAEPSSSAANATPAPKPPAALEGSLVVLGKLKELEFHSRAHLERLAELTMTVEDELKQKDIVGPLGEAYSAQSAFQVKLTALIDVYKAECDRMQGEDG